MSYIDNIEIEGISYDLLSITDDTLLENGVPADAAQTGAAIGGCLNYQANVVADTDLDTLSGIGTYYIGKNIPVIHAPSDYDSSVFAVLHHFPNFRDGGRSQLFVQSTSMWFRTGSSAAYTGWVKICTPPDLLDNKIFVRRDALTAQDDANNLSSVGYYAKSASIEVPHMPTQKSGHLYTMVYGLYPYQMYQSKDGCLYMRGTTGEPWTMATGPQAFCNSLYKKTIIGLGDSLMEGYGLSASEQLNKTWLGLIRDTYDATVYNEGVSGSPVAEKSPQATPPPSLYTRFFYDWTEGGVEHEAIITKYADTQVDYFVVEGGANDLPNYPQSVIGSVDSRTSTEFSGALNRIVDGIRATWPRCKILFLTNFDRKVRKVQNKTDEDYVNAMIAVAKYRSIPYIDNYHDIGCSIKDYYTETLINNTYTVSAQKVIINIEGLVDDTVRVYAHGSETPATKTTDYTLTYSSDVLTITIVTGGALDGETSLDIKGAGYIDNWFFPNDLNQHLSVDAYAWVARIYAKKLESI